jgi:ATP-dependent exoDNAse (exonuclease V) beta subunit
VLEGIIDLVFEGPSGDLVIVDYKTDRLKGGEPLSQAAEPYIHQMGAYALAVEGATGRRVSEAVIVFASRAAAGQDSEYHLTDLDAAKSEAARLAAETVTADG